MTTLTIPDLDDDLQATLRTLAARHGHSVEEEARGILRQVLTQPQSPPPLGQRLVQRCRGVAMDLPLPAHRLPRTPPQGDDRASAIPNLAVSKLLGAN